MSDNQKIRRRQRCPKCGSLDVIKWGVRDGAQRFKCRNCKYLFSSRRKDISKSNRFPWFGKWVSGRMTIEEISKASGRLRLWRELDPRPHRKKCNNSMNVIKLLHFYFYPPEIESS